MTNQFISHIVPCLFNENCNIAATAESLANWTIHLILFVSALKHTVLNQCSKARIDPDKVAELLGMLLKF